MRLFMLIRDEKTVERALPRRTRLCMGILLHFRLSNQGQMDIRSKDERVFSHFWSWFRLRSHFSHRILNYCQFDGPYKLNLSTNRRWGPIKGSDINACMLPMLLRLNFISVKMPVNILVPQYLYCTGQLVDRWNVLCEHKSLLDYPKLIVDEHFKLTLSFWEQTIGWLQIKSQHETLSMWSFNLHRGWYTGTLFWNISTDLSRFFLVMIYGISYT